MSTNNLSVADVATKKIRELTESEELKGWIPIDSNVFGTKKFNAENIALKDAVQAAMSNLNNKIETETNARITLGTRLSSLETKLRGALVFKESLTVSQISNLSLSSIEPGFMYTASNAGTIQYTLGGTAKTLTVEAYDEVAWGATGWYIVGRDHEVDLSEYTKTDDLAAVALSNSYNDLDNKPEIPAEQVNADWNASEGKAVILNKPVLAALALSGDWDDILNKPNFHNVATSGDYRDLNNKPTVGTGVITLQVNGTTADSFSANANENKTINLQIAIPAKTSDLTNDSGFVTLDDIPTATVYDDGLMSHEDHSKLQGIEAGAQVNVKPDWNAAAGSDAEILNKPAIPDVSGKAEKSEMSVEAVSGDSTKKKVTLKSGLSVDVVTDHQDISGKANTTDIPTKTSDLTNDSGFITKTQKVTVSGTLSSGTLSFTVTEGSFAVLDPGANTDAGTITINFVNASGRSANDLFEAAFEIDLSVFSNRESLVINFSKNGMALDIAHVGNKPDDMTTVKILMGVIANDVLFLNETETSN